jgi:hypothetical protein
MEWHPVIRNRIAFPEIGVEFRCPNTAYDIIAAGPILKPFIPLTVVPILIGFVTTPFSYDPEQLVVEMRFGKEVDRVEFVARDVSLVTGDGRSLNPARIAYGGASDRRELPGGERIVVENGFSWEFLSFHFEQSARKTARFEFSIRNASVNGSAVDLPRMRFEKSRGLRFFLAGP